MSDALGRIDAAVGRAFARLAALHPEGFARACEIAGLTPCDVLETGKGRRRLSASEIQVFAQQTGVAVSFFYVDVRPEGLSPAND